MTKIKIPTTWSSTRRRPLQVDEVFNGYLAANIMNALDRLGVLEMAALCRIIRPSAVSTVSGSNESMIEQLLATACALGYLEAQTDGYAPTAAGLDLFEARGYFTWAVGGYYAVLAHADRVATGQGRFGLDTRRDEALVGLGSSQVGAAYMVDQFDRVSNTLEFDVLADLGSGTCQRLCRAVQNRPGAVGMGLDISKATTSQAIGNITKSGLTGRVEAHQVDVMEVLFEDGSIGSALRAADVVMSFFLLHDLLAQEATRYAVLPRMREVFADASTFVLADTTVRPPTPGIQPPVFSAGFELTHSLMSIPLYTRAQYEDLFQAAGLRLREAVALGTPNSWIFVLDVV
jgi:hypothetical protein